MDYFTLERQIGKFARLCINIDVTKPLRGNLNLAQLIIYEGLHEICAYCGDEEHKLENYGGTVPGREQGQSIRTQKDSKKETTSGVVSEGKEVVTDVGEEKNNQMEIVVDETRDIPLIQAILSAECLQDKGTEDEGDPLEENHIETIATANENLENESHNPIEGTG